MIAYVLEGQVLFNKFPKYSQTNSLKIYLDYTTSIHKSFTIIPSFFMNINSALFNFLL